MFSFKKIILGILAISIFQATFADPINGAGSSAAQPLYTKWATAYAQKTGFDVEYDAIGSTAGIKKIKGKLIDFGASDVALSADDLQQNQMIQFPSAISGVVPVVNLPGIKPGELKLNGSILSGIFSHQITKWNDAAITALNPNLSLPKVEIIALARLDGSGTTYNFSDYLSHVSPDWKAHFGCNFIIKWPAEIQQIKGSNGIVATIKQTPNSISYVEYSYVVQEKLSFVQLQNADGNFVSPKPANFEAALNHSGWKTQANFNETLTDKAGPTSWPITMGTFIIMPKVTKNNNQTIAALKFFSWGFIQGDRYVNNLDFVHLPDSIQAKIFKQMMSITDTSGNHLNWSPI
ncbi:phosphate ABC transporter substrate-binding protein PstS [Solimicrobium silvestre]|uniref:Phosphate-binding protein PstS n=1 Tax=Solimicrobium silvestre TaxID=2099400 RepID=A0A2S9H5Q6_9BURK|nr:phosphate ABC transporter substrate-binding protein PstS [Solimicrobium silvestre]PRC95263.1 Phosphate ABC transporter, phosphate-binding protein PstS [Solimicrobium silvestre]